jgi:ATP-binding cassette subfamily B protein
MIAKFYGKSYSLQTLREKSYLSRDGVSMMGISEAAESIGFRTMGVSLTPEKLFSTAPLPLVVHWKQNHFVVVYKVTKDTVYVADPAFGLVKYTKTEFLKNWISVQQDGEKKGLALPTMILISFT